MREKAAIRRGCVLEPSIEVRVADLSTRYPGVIKTLARCVIVAALAVSAAAAWAADANKVLRLAFPDVSGLDPQQVGDLYSVRIAQQIFEGLYEYSYLAKPVRVIPNTAAALPEMGDDGRRWTIRLRKGIRFTDDP